LAKSQLEEVRVAVSAGEAESEVRGLRQRALQTLRRLRPRAEGSLSAVRLPTGEVTTDMKKAAPALVNYWSAQFRGKGTSAQEDVRRWCRAMPKFTDVMPECPVKEEHVRRAIRAAGDTAPGPDGIPYSFWKNLGDLGVTVLYDTLIALMADDSEAAMLRDYGSGDNRFGDCDFNGSLLVLLPKKPAGHDAAVGDFFDPSDTRPLMLVDTSNRLLASALRFAVEPAFEQLIGDGQRGFINGKSILANVLDIEVAMQRAALDEEEAYAMLFDMRAAFPSLEHDYLHLVLEELRVPVGVRMAIRALYAGQSCCLSMAGQWWPGFRITAGIRQGCPFSPLLFVLATEPFNRQLSTIAGVRERCAFADDLAVVGAQGRQAWPQLRALFERFATASGLHLNLAKTVFIPLWTWQKDEAAEIWCQGVPQWDAVRIAFSGTYLGFEVGPAAADTSWKAPLRKYREAVCGWVGRAPGLHLATLAYNTFAISKLQYVAQLHGVPPDWAEIEQWAVRRLFPGPRGWLPPAVAHSLRDELGLPSQLNTLETAGPAAQVRVAVSGGDHRRRLQLDGVVAALERARLTTNAVEVAWQWRSWFDNGPVQRLLATVRALAGQGITERAALEHGLGPGPRPATHQAWQRARRRLQSSITAMLRRRAWLRRGLDQFAAKVRRWQLPKPLPGLRANRCRRVMKQLPKRTPPRVRAAMLRTWLDGWCTSRRFGDRGGRCAFGCPLGDDAVQHYVCCPRLWRFGAAHLNAEDPGTAEARTVRALLWESGASAADLATMATLVAVGYRAYNVLRSRPVTQPQLDVNRLFVETLRAMGGPPIGRTRRRQEANEL